MFKKFSVAPAKIPHLACCVVIALTLAACGADGTAAAPNGTTSAAPQPFIVNGVPPTTVRAGAKYQYIPSAANSDGRALSFSITNKPDWATFGETNGELSGIPDTNDVGTTPEIQIVVSDGASQATVGPFRIIVIPIAPSPAPRPSASPTITGTPSSSVTAGQGYSFTPVVTAPTGESVSFSILNIPCLLYTSRCV